MGTIKDNGEYVRVHLQTTIAGQGVHPSSGFS